MSLLGQVQTSQIASNLPGSGQLTYLQPLGGTGGNGISLLPSNEACDHGHQTILRHENNSERENHHDRLESNGLELVGLILGAES